MVGNCDLLCAIADAVPPFSTPGYLQPAEYRLCPTKGELLYLEARGQYSAPPFHDRTTQQLDPPTMRPMLGEFFTVA